MTAFILATSLTCMPMRASGQPEGTRYGMPLDWAERVRPESIASLKFTGERFGHGMPSNRNGPLVITDPTTIRRFVVSLRHSHGVHWKPLAPGLPNYIFSSDERWTETIEIIYKGTGPHDPGPVISFDPARQSFGPEFARWMHDVAVEHARQVREAVGSRAAQVEDIKIERWHLYSETGATDDVTQPAEIRRLTAALGQLDERAFDYLTPVAERWLVLLYLKGGGQYWVVCFIPAPGSPAAKSSTRPPLPPALWKYSGRTSAAFTPDRQTAQTLH